MRGTLYVLGWGLLGLGAAGLRAQDFVSEFEPQEEISWSLRSGDRPRIRACQTQPNASIRCRADEYLSKVVCVAYHFGREQIVEARLNTAANEFSCEGTRFAGRSLSNQWLILLRGEGGRQARWLVDVRTAEQGRFARELQLQSEPVRRREGGYALGLGFVARSGPGHHSASYPLHGLALDFGREDWALRTSFVRRFGGGPPLGLLSAAGDWTRFRSDLQAFSPLLRFRASQQLWDRQKVWSHAFGAGLLYRYGTRLRAELLPRFTWYRVDRFQAGYGVEGGLEWRVWNHWSLAARGHFGQVYGSLSGRSWRGWPREVEAAIFWRSAPF